MRIGRWCARLPRSHTVSPVRSDGCTLLVDRSFISKDFTQKHGHSEEGEVEILGMLRTSDRARNTFTPDNEPAEGKWYWANLKAMADHMVRSFVFDASFDSPAFERCSLSAFTGIILDNKTKGTKWRDQCLDSLLTCTDI